jgi:hypothetical protein
MTKKIGDDYKKTEITKEVSFAPGKCLYDMDGRFQVDNAEVVKQIISEIDDELNEIMAEPKPTEGSQSPSNGTDHSVAAYDPENAIWRRCPICGNEAIGFVSERSGIPYQACRKCRIFLERHGATSPMTPIQKASPWSSE